IMAVYPDALIIQTHRDPVTAMASACSLASHATDGWSETFRGAAIGRSQLDLWARGLETFTAARRRYDPAQFADVDYADFVADPLATVAGVYERFGMEFTAQARTAMEEMHAASRSGARKPAHRYSLGDFGLTEGQVTERFGR